MIVVADAGPLIALLDLGLAHVLEAIFAEVLVPPTVAREVFEARPRIRPPWIRVQSPAGAAPPALRSEAIDTGEQEALHLALDVAADLVLADDRRARAAGRRLGLIVAGTLAVLVLARRQSRLPALRPVLDTLVAGGFRLTPELYAAVLAAVGE